MMTDKQIKALLEQRDRRARELAMLAARIAQARRAYADRIGQIPPVRIETLRLAVAHG